MLEKGVTHTCDDPSAPAVMIASKVEETNPEVYMPARLARKFGLAPEQKTFLFKMLQSLLPTRERLARIGKFQSPAGTFCSAPQDNTAQLLSCTQSTAVTSPLLRCLSDHADNITPQKIVLLNIHPHCRVHGASCVACVHLPDDGMGRQSSWSSSKTCYMPG